MQENNGYSLREIVEQLPTPKLDEMLQAELKKSPADPNAVRLILAVLEEREANEPVEMDDQTKLAWERYQNRLEEIKPQAKPVRHLRRRWLIPVAAMLAVVITCIIPMQANAETFREMLTRWKQDILEFFDPSEKVIPKELVFKTDNEGLQQIYDAALEIGVEEPLIPMWLWDYELSKCEVSNTPSVNSIMATLKNGYAEAIILVEVFDESPLHGYFGEESVYDAYEKNGAKFEITHNNGKWIAVWEKDSVEYSIAIDCQEETLRRILASIYVMEE